MGGEFFTGNYIQWPAAFRHNFWSAGNNPNPNHDLLNSKSISFDRLSRTTTAKFQVIPIRGFRFIVLTYTPTHIHTHRDKMIAKSASTTFDLLHRRRGYQEAYLLVRQRMW